MLFTEDVLNESYWCHNYYCYCYDITITIIIIITYFQRHIPIVTSKYLCHLPDIQKEIKIFSLPTINKHSKYRVTVFRKANFKEKYLLETQRSKHTQCQSSGHCRKCSSSKHFYSAVNTLT